MGIQQKSRDTTQSVSITECRAESVLTHLCLCLRTVKSKGRECRVFIQLSEAKAVHMNANHVIGRRSAPDPKPPPASPVVSVWNVTNRQPFQVVVRWLKW